MSIITVAYPSLDLMQQVLNTPHAKGGGGHQDGNQGFNSLIEAQLGGQVAAAMATPPRAPVNVVKLVTKKERDKDKSDREEREEEEAQEREQSSSGRSMWA